jgi:hypothetical protein
MDESFKHNKNKYFVSGTHARKSCSHDRSGLILTKFIFQLRDVSFTQRRC